MFGLVLESGLYLLQYGTVFEPKKLSKSPQSPLPQTPKSPKTPSKQPTRAILLTCRLVIAPSFVVLKAQFSQGFRLAVERVQIGQCGKNRFWSNCMHGLQKPVLGVKVKWRFYISLPG